MQGRSLWDSPKLSTSFNFSSFKSSNVKSTLPINTNTTNINNNNYSAEVGNNNSLAPNEFSSQKNLSFLQYHTQKTFNKVWEELSIPLEDSVVYLDTPTIQVIKYSSEGGLDILYENGAINIKNIDNYVYDDEEDKSKSNSNNNEVEKNNYLSISDTKKIVIILSGYLMEYENKIKNILLEHAYQECHIYTTISEASHNLRLQRISSLQQDHPKDLGTIAFQYLQGNDEAYFTKFQNKLKQWITMGNEM